MLRGDGPYIAKGLEARMARVLEDGEEMPDVAHLLDVLGRMVVAEVGDVYEAEKARTGRGSDQYWARRDLRENAAELRKRVVDVRKWLRGNYSAAEIKEQVGSMGRTPRGTEQLEDMAKVLVRNLPDLKPRQGPREDARRRGSRGRGRRESRDPGSREMLANIANSPSWPTFLTAIVRRTLSAAAKSQPAGTPRQAENDDSRGISRP